MPVHRHPIALINTQNSGSEMPLDLALIDRLQTSFDLVRQHGLRFGEVFYTKLFDAAPQLRPLFRDDPESQNKKLLSALDTIVRNLRDPEGNREILAALGRRHVQYGAVPAHYDLVIDLLIDSMKEVLGAQATIRVLEEWRTALRLVSDQMIAASAPPTAP